MAKSTLRAAVEEMNALSRYIIEAQINADAQLDRALHGKLDGCSATLRQAMDRGDVTTVLDCVCAALILVNSIGHPDADPEDAVDNLFSHFAAECRKLTTEKGALAYLNIMYRGQLPECLLREDMNQKMLKSRRAHVTKKMHALSSGHKCLKEYYVLVREALGFISTEYHRMLQTTLDKHGPAHHA